MAPSYRWLLWSLVMRLTPTRAPSTAMFSWLNNDGRGGEHVVLNIPSHREYKDADAHVNQGHCSASATRTADWPTASLPPSA